MPQEHDNILPDSTPHAYPACSSEADQAGACFLLDSTPRASLDCSDEADHAGACLSPLKKPLSSEQLAHHLIDKGLSAPNIEDLIRILDTYGYYRLKGYCLTLQKNGSFKDGTDIQSVLEIEEFNRELSSFLLGCIAPIEIAMRSQLSSVLALHYGPDALHNPNVFSNQNDFRTLQRTLKRETEQSIFTKKPLSLHNIAKYGELPIWAEMENSSFGTTSRIFENLADQSTAAEIACFFGVSRTYLKGWLRYLTQIRNTCAHQDRLYNRMFCILPKLFKEHNDIDKARLFPTFIVLFRLHEAMDPNRANLLRQELGRIIDSHPTVDLKPVGFPVNWREVLRIPDPDKRSLVRPRGRNGGHPLKDAAVIQQALYQYDMHQGTVAEIAKRCGLSLSTLYKYINQRKEADRERIEYAVVSLEE